MLFCKCGCLVGLENRIFRKSISFDRKKYALTTEIHFRSYFHFKWFPEREREREREGEPQAPVQSDDCQRTLSSSPSIARTSRTGLIDRSTASIAPRRSISRAPVRRSHAPDRTGLVNRSTAPLDLAFNLASVRSRLRPTDLSLFVILISV